MLHVDFKKWQCRIFSNVTCRKKLPWKKCSIAHTTHNLNAFPLETKRKEIIAFTDSGGNIAWTTPHFFQGHERIPFFLVRRGQPLVLIDKTDGPDESLPILRGYSVDYFFPALPCRACPVKTTDRESSLQYSTLTLRYLIRFKSNRLGWG